MFIYYVLFPISLIMKTITPFTLSFLALVAFSSRLFSETNPTTAKVFDDVIRQNIIVAPHTLYATDGELKDAYVINDMVDMEIFEDTESCKFVQPECWQVDEDFDEIVGFARQMAQMVTFADKKEAAELQVALNKCIREGREVVPETFNNSRLISYWFLIKSIKDDMLFMMRNNGPSAYIGDRQCRGEGYVGINQYGMFKLVSREQFSHANFNNGRFANV